MDQRSLVEQAGKGDHEAFALLVDAAIARLDAAARLILRDPELARDAVQDALVRAWRDLPGLRDPDRFDAWLHRLIVHSSLDLARRRRRRVIEVELTSLDDRGVPDPTRVVDDRDLIDRALARLEPEARAMVVLHHYLGMTVPDVADSLGVPLGTAKAKLSRSVARMRPTMEDSNEATTVPVAEGRSA